MRENIFRINLLNYWRNIDKKIFVSFIILFFLGLFFSFSSTSSLAGERLNKDYYFFFSKHLIFTFMALSIMILISIMGSAGIFFLISAYRFGAPVVLAPFEYIYLVFAITLGYFIFDEFPDFYSIIGLFLIVISGIYIVFRENKRDELVVSETTLRS